MRRIYRHKVLAAVAIMTSGLLVGCDLAHLGPPPPPVIPPAAARPVDFERDVKPILAQHCVKCHDGKKASGGLRLDVKEKALAGGGKGVVIKPGEGAESLLVRSVSGVDPDVVMPPKNQGPRLGAEQIGLIRAWIDQGAVWPDLPEPAPAVATNGPPTPASANPAKLEP